MPIYSAVALVLLALWLCWRYIAWRPTLRGKLWPQVLAFAPATLLLLPLGNGLLLIHYVHGLLGALSITTLALIAASVLLQARPLPGALPVYVLLALSALLLYVSAEGGIALDIYNWGYSGWQLPLIISLLLVLSLLSSNHLGAYLLSASILAYALKLHPSPNLFDLLFDFPLALVLSLHLLARLWYWARWKLEEIQT